MRQPLIHADSRVALYKYLYDKVVEYGGTALAVGGMENHVHLVFSIPPQVALSPFVGRLKGSSSHWIDHFVSPGGSFAWQGGYGVLTVADNDLDRVCSYIRDQEIHHHRGSLIPSYEEMNRRLGPTAG